MSIDIYHNDIFIERLEIFGSQIKNMYIVNVYVNIGDAEIILQ